MLYSSLSAGQLEHGPGACRARGVCLTTCRNTSHQPHKGALASPLPPAAVASHANESFGTGKARQNSKHSTMSETHRQARQMSRHGKPLAAVCPKYFSCVSEWDSSMMHCCTRYPPLQDQQVFLEHEASPHHLLMPLTQNEGSCCHLKHFLFHQEISLSTLPSSSGGVSIKTELLAMFSKESGCEAMNSGAAQVPQDNISFMVFILLPVFLQLSEGVTDFVGSAERKSSSLSFVLGAEQFWLFSCQKLLWTTTPDFHLPLSSPGKVWPFTLRPDFH